MSGLLMRRYDRWPWWSPIALVPIIAASLKLVTAGGVSLAFGGDRIVHHISALAKLELANSFLNAPW